MSALARYLVGRGIEVHGYDLTKTPLTEALEAEGMAIHYEEDITKIPEGIDLVVYTPAVPKTHKELVWFWKKGFPVLKRAEVLGIISRDRKAIGIAGTHGKTTTSTILTHILRKGGVDCTAFLGGISGNYKSNYVEGKGEWVVIEADEFDRSFLQLDPDIAVILAMDADHLDIYGHAEAIEDSFKAYAEKVKANGTVFLKHNLSLGNTTVKTQSFGVEGGAFCSKNIRVEEGHFVFDLVWGEGEMKDLKFTLPGRHNVENATAAIAVALELGVKEKAIRNALASFKGIKRRFDQIVKSNILAYIDDYAHHPEELKAAISAAKTLFPGKEITGIFQPHLFSRTKDFAEGFAKALDELDNPILLDIYPARELPMEGVTSKLILDLMKNPRKRLISKSEAKEEFQNTARLEKVEVLMTLGAGNIDQLVPTFKKSIKKFLKNYELRITN